jgi:hypothetical protein
MLFAQILSDDIINENIYKYCIESFRARIRTAAGIYAIQGKTCTRNANAAMNLLKAID